ncbi:Uncharacterized protein APZ42_004816 [Daphnia magna]|uniref:Uncharacterized protein n=1 Tax=Daphnia magna TaxID=35525 RepID=A0A164GTT2_9CRUS|nr:Uncharacterized protein APZ42_004816 [Daphnia magna]
MVTRQQATSSLTRQRPLRNPRHGRPNFSRFWRPSPALGNDPNLEIGSKGELMPRSKLRWEPFNLRSQYYMVFGEPPSGKKYQ